MTGLAWDRRLARLLVRPLRESGIHPNHLTTLSLVVGLGAGVLFAQGDFTSANWAAGLFMFAVFLDHTDGELARIAERSTRLGGYYDYAAGCVIYATMFLGLGFGLAGDSSGVWPLLLGCSAGLAIPLITALRLAMEVKHGPLSVRHPSFAGIEIEDFVYLIGPITWTAGPAPFLLAYGVGTLGYLLWTTAMFVRLSTART